ncbi:uncharacterized protein LOC122522880 isoform X1 [Polistes fuscatus]|uniref:uncharacterized protein LOC122522880 isoform X1 n=1 Tax=Polistes fuscatus TaxID=30207 RepID=UPI001CA86089|nr:uncharacterized protein LOC122522880 isoform X1 [Polistes fuscatus]
MKSSVSKMNTQVIVTFCLFVLVFGVSCESTSFEQSSSIPLTFVYAVYPFYNSETLLQVWKNDESAEVYANVVTVNPGEQEYTILNAGSTISRNETIDPNVNRNSQVLKNDAENVNADRLSQTRQQLRNYKTWRRSTNFQNE